MLKAYFFKQWAICHRYSPYTLAEAEQELSETLRGSLRSICCNFLSFVRGLCKPISFCWKRYHWFPRIYKFFLIRNLYNLLLRLVIAQDLIIFFIEVSENYCKISFVPAFSHSSLSVVIQLPENQTSQSIGSASFSMGKRMHENSKKLM